MISEKISTRTVNTAETTPTGTLSNTSPARHPTADAPAVLAMVFKVRIAASGRSMSSLSRCSRSPMRRPERRSAAT